MGLCKCPKRRVTNQFCFEHRVNVCEHCMVQKHPNCVVQSYLQWLQDSDYNPNCAFCDQELANETCVRLACYHSFHWVCLDKWARSLPNDTAPAGYTCPTCNECIFPSENLVSPVADALRGLLTNVNWARPGLGLPLLEERNEQKPEFSFVPVGPRPPPEGESVATPISSHKDGAIPKFSSPLATNRGSLSKDPGYMHASIASSVTSPLLVNSTVSSSTINVTSDDTDENKYKRRSALTWFARWWKTTIGPSLRGSGRGRATKQRYIMIGVMVLVGFFTLIAIFHYFGRSGDENDFHGDPMLDPMNNPNIRVGVN